MDKQVDRWIKWYQDLSSTLKSLGTKNIKYQSTTKKNFGFEIKIFYGGINTVKYT